VVGFWLIPFRNTNKLSGTNPESMVNDVVVPSPVAATVVAKNG
jgi:hypothetical protein